MSVVTPYDDFFKFLVVTLPLLCVFFPALFLPSQANAASNVPFRPPGYVFGIVWTILCFIIPYVGYNVIFNPNKTPQCVLLISYIFMCFSFLLWLLVYSGIGSKIGGIVTLVLGLICTIIFLVLASSNSATWWLIILVAWLLFATSINVAEVLMNN